MIAALYVEKSGPYFKMDGVDPWGVDRDARKYTGPHPVIAHPPCGPYSVLRKFYKGEEHDCAPSALATVRKWGGVLEHPRYSKFWRVANLPDPGEGDAWGFTVEVNQVAWGHVARKPTWLYFVNVPRDRVMQTIKTGGTPTHWLVLILRVIVELYHLVLKSVLPG